MKIFFNHPKKSPAKLDFLSPISEKWTILKAPKNEKTRNYLFWSVLRAFHKTSNQIFEKV